ncbi:putative early growth response protein [Talaromyces proteolyticus]|uniref:Early growth response protein n=1 Tax=Talaromyces proteolyticus TaxID=1131652 RepID=A0AAD4KQJ2_9EURO|nr:putative early growth response protein [Talaromyces proteolyticus]KAH8693219.1 putative early growth response protein [Talaromyces proteolyticus]
MLEQHLESGHGTSSPPPPAKRPKRFQCQHCLRLFARLEHLQRHERTHTQEKPFSCNQCDQRFTRSDLLIRHERLSHLTDRRASSQSEKGGSRGLRGRRKRTAQAANIDEQEPEVMSPTVNFEPNGVIPTNNSPIPSMKNHTIPLVTLSMAAEQAALQGIIPPIQENAIAKAPNNAQVSFPEQEQLEPQLAEVNYGLDFEDSLDNLAAFLDNGPLTSQHFSSFISAEQPIPFFSPESASQSYDLLQEHPQRTPAPVTSMVEEPGSFSRFGSRLPSLQPEESPAHRDQNFNLTRKPLSDISAEDRQHISLKLNEFSSFISPDFRLPSRLALSRYLAGYINGFHEHMPCLHVQTMSVQKCSIELLLAMAAVGTQYCFEGEKGVELFHISQEIAMRRIRRRDARVAAHAEQSQSSYSNSLQHNDQMNPQQSFQDIQPHNAHSPSLSGPLGLPSDQEHDEDLMQTAQALFLLMAMATWAKHKEILRQALAIQSILATLVREDGLKMGPLTGEDVSWEEWIRYECIKRTKFIVFCFFNLHCIVYNIPSLILSSELDLPLPCSAAEFKAPSAVRWREAKKKQQLPEIHFQTAFHRLFNRSSYKDSDYSYTSSLGNYILIHALIQHIFFVRQIVRCRIPNQPSTAYHNQDQDSDEISSLEQALRNWQLGWEQNPESSLDPLDPNGPIAFNSTALLRLAYIRLNNIFVGPGHHALATRDPVQIAHSFRESPATRIRRTRKLVRAVLHSAHALSIPVKIGIRLVARTQTFTWSIQHSICSLECAFLLCKWLEALALPHPQPEVSEDEKRICWLVKTMLDETEYGVRCDDEHALQSPSMLRQLSAGVLRVWAQIFKGAQTWAVVDVIGTALNTYADMLDDTQIS